MTDHASSAAPPPMPFIVGVPRSGTTLLRLMLDAHPAMAIPPETHFLGAVLRLGRDVDGRRQHFCKAIVEHPRWSDFQLSAEAFGAALDAIVPLTATDGLRCFYRMYAARFGKARYGDKTPLHALQLNAIEAVLPEAHFIHIVRDGRDVAVSQSQHFQHWMNGDVTVCAKLWKDTVLETRRQGARCRRFLEIQYETLVRRAAPVLKEIAAFLQLPHDSRMETYYVGARQRLEEFDDLHSSTGEIIETKALRLHKHDLALTPPSDARVGRWRTELSASDRHAFEGVAGALLTDLGYDV